VNERQRDLFLYIWSQRRKLGQAGAALRGALVGALGGLVFAAVMAGEIGAGDTGGYTGLSVIIPMIQRGGALLLLSVGAFAGIGFVLANRVFASQEAMYQAILSSGAQVPAQKPVMQGADRWPAIAVGVVAAVIAAFIIVLFVMYW
jgi:hypothetical protein